ncbi:hypothetical protein [Candidatus Villigracilis affinis]|uniref:hypothetical protein n=1 Tax=Candidatus Villigracilis affinis TaxID=3140682 RepID=UPI002A208CCF|nr:hypothetical protein [Anaerolineales bacterium]
MKKAKSCSWSLALFPPFLPVGYSIRVIKFIKYLPAWAGSQSFSAWMINRNETLPKVGGEALLSEISQL